MSISTYAFANCSALSEVVIGTSNCKLDGSNAFNGTGITSSTGSIYVPFSYMGAYKSSTNWQYFKDRIFSLAVPIQCLALRITADDVSGRKTKTTIHWEADVIVEEKGVVLPGTHTISGDVESEEFPQNTSETDSVERTISFTYMGVSATTTITQGVWINEYVEVSLQEGAYGFVEETDTTKLVPGYTVYKSTNKGRDSTKSIAKLTFIGYTDFTLYIRSNAESSYDYTYVTTVNSSSNTQENWSTKGKQNATATISGYTSVQLTGLTDGSYVYVGFTKDGSQASGDDTGWFLIPND